MSVTCVISAIVVMKEARVHLCVTNSEKGINESSIDAVSSAGSFLSVAQLVKYFVFLTKYFSFKLLYIKKELFFAFKRYITFRSKVFVHTRIQLINTLECKHLGLKGALY